eukprot:Selendium_serpulae@DN5864_c0_g1_i3.p1
MMSHNTPPTAIGAQERDLAATDNLPDFVKHARTQLFQKKRPWIEFFGSGLFTKPSDRAECIARVERNLRYFFVNYIFVSLGICAFAVLLKPIVLVWMIMCGSLYYWIQQRGEIVTLPGGSSFPRDKLIVAVGVLFGIGFLFFAGALMLSCLGLSIVVTLAHSLFHVGKVYDEIEENGELP